MGVERVRGSENEVVQAGKSEDREKKNKTKQKNQMVRKAVAFRSLAERWKTKMHFPDTLAAQFRP